MNFNSTSLCLQLVQLYYSIWYGRSLLELLSSLYPIKVTSNQFDRRSWPDLLHCFLDSFESTTLVVLFSWLFQRIAFLFWHHDSPGTLASATRIWHSALRLPLHLLSLYTESFSIDYYYSSQSSHHRPRALPPSSWAPLPHRYHSYPKSLPSSSDFSIHWQYWTHYWYWSSQPQSCFHSWCRYYRWRSYCWDRCSDLCCLSLRSVEDAALGRTRCWSRIRGLRCEGKCSAARWGLGCGLVVCARFGLGSLSWGIFGDRLFLPSIEASSGLYHW